MTSTVSGNGGISKAGLALSMFTSEFVASVLALTESVLLSVVNGGLEGRSSLQQLDSVLQSGLLVLSGLLSEFDVVIDEVATRLDLSQVLDDSGVGSLGLLQVLLSSGELNLVFSDGSLQFFDGILQNLLVLLQVLDGLVEFLKGLLLVI